MISVYELGQMVEARATDRLSPEVLVFSATPPDEESRGVGYVIIDMDPGRVRYSRAAGEPEHDGRWQMRVCGSSPSQARNTLDLVRAAFLGWRPFADLRYGVARETDAGPEIPDTSEPADLRWSYTLTYDIDDGDDYAQ